MARNNEVLAKVRISIGGVEASKQHLHALETSASLLHEQIQKLKKDELKFTNEGDVKNAAEAVKQIRSLEADFKRVTQVIEIQKRELNNYVNILDNLSGTELVHLQKGLRSLQTQMKETLTLGDVERYGKLKAAYDELMSSVEQLSGKMPNLTYVMKNLGQVSTKTLTDSIAYTEKLIASTDKTTKRGRDNIKAWSNDLKTMRDQLKDRSFKVLETPGAYSVEQIQQAISNLKKLQPSLKLTGQAWEDYAQKIKKGEEYLKSYDEQQKKLAEKELKRKTNEVLANPAGFSQADVEEAIRNAEKLQKAYKVGSPWWKHYKTGIEEAKKSLDSFNQEQKEAAEAARKLQTTAVLEGLSDPNNQTAFTTQQIQDAIKHGKELQSQLEHMGPDWIKYALQIKTAEEALDAYNKEQKELEKSNAELKRKTDTDALLPKLYDKDEDFTQQQLEDFIKNAKEIQKELTIGKSEWINYADGIKQAEKRLKEYDEQQKESAVRLTATTAISERNFIRKDDGTFNITGNEAKARVEAIQKYIGTLNMSDNADEIRKATEALDVYNTALGKVKDTTVDVNAILDDPKNFSTEELQKAIKQLEETGLKIKVDDSDAIQKNIDDIEKLKTALADSAYSETVVNKVIEDAKKGEASVVELEKAIASTKEKLRHTKDADLAEKLKKQLDQLNPALELTKTSLSRVNETLGNIKGSNLGSLKEAAERLKAEITDVNFNMDEFAKKSEQLRKVKKQIKELEDQTNNAATAMEKAASRLQNWVLIYAGSQEIWNAITRTFQGALQLSDAMTDVQKTTGLTADEVERLTNSIQELDSRVTNEKLMEAATEAGRIGLKTRKEVLEFTRASAITLTALDELDARSITSVMKLNSLLGETARLGVQQAILSTASSINELSMASSAAQQPIIDFSRRFGGIAAQANIGTADVLALGATIDALGQPIEMSSTALNKFTTALLSNGKQIAEDTGLSEEYVFQMTRQGKTIELMIEVLGKLNNMGGIGEIQKYMGDMGGEGARMTAVVSALAANLGFLRQNLDLSNRSFEEGISVLNEYNLKNENAAALVARMGNDIKEAFTNSLTVKVVTFFVSLLQGIVHFLTSGSVAASAFNKVLLLVIVRMAMLNTTIKSINKSILESKISWASFISLLTKAGAGFTALGRAIKGLFVGNPLGWIVVGVSLLMDLVSWMISTKDATEETKKAIDRVNDSFEEESYKLNKLREALEEVKNDKAKLSEIASTLNRDYGEELGYVISMTAGYKELAGAIELASAAKRKRIIQDEKDRNFQNVQEEFRDQITEALNSLKSEIGIGSGWSGLFEQFSKEAQTDLYSAIAQDLNKSAEMKGVAELGSSVENVLRNQAKAAAEKFFRVTYQLTDELLATVDTSKKEQEFYERYQRCLATMDAIEKLGEIYVQKSAKIKELDAEVDRQLVTRSAVVSELQQKQIDIISAENDLSNKAAKDYTAEDENTLQSIISLYESMLVNIDQSMDMNKWSEINEHVQFFKNRQREVMLAFVENPLRGIKMKVGEDGKLYKEVLENGKYQYEAVQKLGDANLRQLVDAYRRTESTFQNLISDKDRLMDSEVRKQADRLSKVKTAIYKELAKNGIDIDNKGELNLRNTEYRDGSERTARQEDSEMRKAYQAMISNIKEFYEEKKKLVLDDFIHEKNTVEEKNRRIKELTEQQNNTIIAMQTELLGEGNAFNEQAFIRDQNNFKKVAGWMLKDTHHFQDEVRKARADLQEDTVAQEVKYREEVLKILLGNDYQAQVDKEMQEALEVSGLFWGSMTDRTAENAKKITSAIKEAAKESYSMDAESYRKRLEENEVFGQTVKEMSDEQFAAYLILLQQFHDKTIEADKKFADQRRKITEQMWVSGGYENQYNYASGNIKDRQENLDMSQSFGATSQREAYEEQQRLTLEQWALEEWKYQMQYELAVKAGETEEQLLERRLEMAEMEKEMQRQVTEAYLEEYNRRADKISQHAEKFGEFAGVMASASWNSVEDRKKAGEELLKYIAQETTEYIRELVVRKIKEEVLRRQGLKEAKKGEEEKQDIEKKGVEESTKITEIGGKIKTGIEEKIAGEVGSIAEAGAVQSATTAVKKASVDSAAGAASGAAKTIGELGWWGIPLIAAIEGVLSMLLNMAVSGLASAFGTSAGNSTKTNKRLATGMLTYAGGRYPVLGDDGVTYNAQYEPRLQTKVYDGGKGKAHMALFSEVMPEMVVSGPTTKIIREDYPALMNAIMMIDKYGSLPQPKRMRRYADGNVDEFDVDMVQNADGTYVESPAIAELRQSNNELRDTVAQLASILERGIHANINMYGSGGIKESMDKANKFYTKNRIK